MRLHACGRGVHPFARSRARTGFAGQGAQLLWVFPFLILFSCDSGDAPASQNNTQGDEKARALKVAQTRQIVAPAHADYVERGDLSALRERKKLRVLLPAGEAENGYLPRKGYPLDFEMRVAERFARQQGLEPVWVYVRRRENLIPYLLEGRGDVIAANLLVTEERKERIEFSVPFTTVREQIVVRTQDTVEKPEDLTGRSVAVQWSSPSRQTLERLREKNSEIGLHIVPENLSAAQILDRVEDGTYDAAIARSNLVGAITSYRSGLRPAFDVSGARAVAWGVRPDSEELIRALNLFLNKEGLVEAQRKPVYKEDLPGIKDRKVLRVLTRNNATTYFLWRGQLLGFEYELIRRFAEQHGLYLQMIVPPSRQNLIPWLLSGQGDVIAASMAITEQRKKYGLGFSRPYNFVSEVVAARADEEGLDSVEDLEGRSVIVRRSSNYWSTLEELRDNGLHFLLKAAPEELEDEEIIARVARGEYDLTVTASNVLDVELTWRDDIKAAFSLGDPVPQGWAVRKEDSELLEALNRFIKKEYRGVFYNLTYKKYFENPRRIIKHVNLRVDKVEGGQLSPYDEIVKKYAEQYGFDWHLLIAQMYQESRFDPGARSWMGALGLMQVLPRTAKQFGFTDLHDPEKGVHAGIRYLAWLRERFDEDISVHDRTWFALASYNAGLGHVRDARRLAKQLGQEPKRWFGEVEQAMLLLARKKYARKAHHGYVRGRETVKYVREIRNRYEAYVDLKRAAERDASQPLPRAVAFAQ
ncbi:MAG: transporter substrate-binding domain-containing protein [Gammaproteobacteria bacterium]|nr:transporter substrate-binding domain-containing protein [Gammaproteobacteria bacterium]NIR84794.1 transporter substrate-binding domain-containing protein [Gammaproteobacteria bacterium]NIR91508.1 transporter substrate-binding domain-containing protein [Gammaproteobacteria bacterium]NIU05841.1 transporter substrate-binding domain-containing protein [Gammaproteobacteria bacterium]NIV76696.1 transporter substrate-binding domain-containing protein [Gammaproteobacteria bacterium]